MQLWAHLWCGLWCMCWRVSAALRTTTAPTYSPAEIAALKNVAAEVSRLVPTRSNATAKYSAAEIVALLLPCGLWALGAMAAASWLQYWRGYLVVSFALAWLFSLWFVAGGLRDLREFEVMLQKIDRDHSDDGSVSHNRCNDPQVVPLELVGACSGDDEPAAIELDEQGALLPSVVLKVATSRSSQKTEDTRALLCSDEEDVGHLLAERP